MNNIMIVNGHSVACCIAQSTLTLTGEFGEISSPSSPLDVSQSSSPTPTGLGFDGIAPPRFGALTREVSPEEMASEAIFVSQVTGEAVTASLRAAGYRGAVLAPGRLTKLPDGRQTAMASSVVVIAPRI